MEKNPRKMMGCLKRHLRAFSVAEMVIILSLVGFVSSVAVGTVTKHVNEQKMEFAGVVTNNEVAISLADMHASEELVGLASEEEFANKLHKHYDVDGAILNKDGTRSSGGSANLADMTYDEFVNKNFAASYTDTANNKTIKASDYNTVLKTAKGASIALTYNRSCSIGSSYTSGGTDANAYTSDAKNTALGCIEGIYDVNGSKGPNKLGVDVGVFQNVKGNCEGNFVMDAAGQCGKVCALTTTNCKAENKTLNKDTCACECTVSCPKGQVLNKDTCTCECAEPPEFNENYCRLDNSDKSKACTPIPKSFLTPAKCLSGGGKWAGDTCDCNCEAKDCKIDSYGYGEADSDQYCDCKCPFTVKNAEFDAIVRKNAEAAGLTGQDLEDAVKRTIPANHTRLTSVASCYACDPNLANNGRIAYKAKQGFCAAECDLSAEASCDQTGGFFKWTGFNKDDISSSCKCTCNAAAKKEEAKQLTSELHAAMGNKVLVTTGSSGLVWSRLDSAVKLGCGTGCTYCCEASRSSGTKQIANIGKKGGVADYDVRAKYTFDDSKGVCAFKFQNVNLTPGQIVDETHFHCWSNICVGYDWLPYYATIQEFASKMGITMPDKFNVNSSTQAYNPNLNRPKTVPGYTNTNINQLHSWWWQQNMKVALWSTYRQWADPIVLNYTDTPEKFPVIIGGEGDEDRNVNFKISYDNGTYLETSTPWIAADPNNMKNSHIFLATIDPASPANLVPDVSFLFSDQKPTKAGNGELYSTGLDQLKDEFDTTVDNNENGVNTGLINKNDIGFTNLRVWWDKNMDAKATADEIKTLDEAKITEFNTIVIRQTSASGDTLQSSNAIYGITGQYKRLIEIGKELNPAYLGLESKVEECKEDKNNCLKWGWGYCKEYGQKCTTKTVRASNAVRYVEPVYDKDGKQILDKWALVLNDKEKADLEEKFQEKVDDELFEQEKAYDTAKANRDSEKETIGQEAYTKAYNDYIAAWQTAKDAKSAADRAKAEADRLKAEQERLAAEAAREKAEAERAKAEEERAKAESGMTEPEAGEGENTDATEGETGDATEGETTTEPEVTEPEVTEPEVTEPEVEEEATEPEAPAYDEELAGLSETKAKENARKAGNQAKQEAMAKVSYDDIVKPTRAKIEAELQKTRDDNTYYTYSPKEESSATYSERWFNFKENQTYDIEIKNQKFIKVFKIGDKYYEEKIYSLSDVLFKV